MPDNRDEMLTTLYDIKTDLAVVKVHVENTKEDTAEIKMQVTKQNGRIRKLENWRWYLGGAIAAVGITGVLKWLG